jgi:hypothetical protein
MPLGKGYTVEEQLTGKAEVGGIQLDVFERLDGAVEVVLEDAEDLFKTPAELKLQGQLKLRHMCVVCSVLREVFGS